MTLRETIALLRQKTEGFRFYILRFVRVFFLYKLFVATVETCVAMMSANGTGDPESVSYNPWEYYGSTSISILIVFIFFAGIFILYDPTARRHFAKNPPPEKSLFSEWIHVFCTYEFWTEIVTLAVLPLIDQTDIFMHPLWIFFRRADFSESEIYVRYLLTILPVFLVIELILRVRTRRYWRDLTREEANDMHLDALAIMGLSLLVLIAYPFLAQFYLGTMVMVVIFVLLPTSLVFIAIGIAVMWVFSLIRALHIRRRFLRRLKKLCKAENIEISEIYRPYLSVFLRKNHDFHFTVKRGGKTYACKMIAAKAKNAQMIFLDEDIGYFKFGFKFRSNDVVFWRSRFYHSFDAKGADHKVHIISPVPYDVRAVSAYAVFQTEKTTFVKESARLRTLDNASKLYDSTVFSGDGFISALQRNCLDRNEI